MVDLSERENGLREGRSCKHRIVLIIGCVELMRVTLSQLNADDVALGQV